MTLESTKCKAFNLGKGRVSVMDEPLAEEDLDSELPRINYEKHNGKKYRYFYGVHFSRKTLKLFSIQKVGGFLCTTTL